ncbi:MAG: UTP--glucose-1-phosphate uridylyltransferase [Chlamydiales bacterium]|nr:UTP--glucose-1-phosphate uridylyltransferase [Chlamydiales bacterium]
MKLEIETQTELEDNYRKLLSYKYATKINDSIEIKLSFLSSFKEVNDVFATLPIPLSLYDEYLIKQVLFIQQQHLFFAENLVIGNYQESFRKLLTHLSFIDHFYHDLGGLVGYQIQVIKMLLEDNKQLEEEIDYSSPTGNDINLQNTFVQQSIYEGIKQLDKMAEMYPMGGAADRLQLVDPLTKDPLPAACLKIMSKTLLEWLIEDLQGREFLYFKCFHQELQTPIVMMTSMDKNNHTHIIQLCEQHDWFHRLKDSFYLFPQPLVPVFDRTGNWILEKPLELILRPGGHGVLWKLADKEGVFEKLCHLKKTKALVRQINNPIAGIDYGLLSFMGIGHLGNKKFGFSSCKRTSGMNEGVNVIKAVKQGKMVSNIEYCDFIHLQHLTQIENFDYYPANTNILFVDLKGIQEATKAYPYPGALLNFRDINNQSIARLELTMQNLAEYFVDDSDVPEEEMQTFLVFNERKKTISAVKKSLKEHDIKETPTSCFFDLLMNRFDLLVKCGFTVPMLGEKRDFSSEQPPFIFDYHPALGPLFDIITQKLQHGILYHGAELILNIADIEIEYLVLQGSLLIETKNIFGHMENNLFKYSDRTGKCTLKNVTINNLGIDAKIAQPYWKGEYLRQEKCHIVLGENAEFIAENIHLKGDIHIIVEDNTKVTAYEENGLILFKREQITGSFPFYTYLFNNDEIQIKRNI